MLTNNETRLLASLLGTFFSIQAYLLFRAGSVSLGWEAWAISMILVGMAWHGAGA